ncbi:MAG: DUF488 domain-containing protein [Candidatus Dormibacteria bacterium]
MARHQIQVKRVYQEPTPGDGRRVLVDRLWPRGFSSAAAPWESWAKALAPSTELRRWYGHEPSRYSEFRARYRRELGHPEARAAVEELLDWARRGPLTVVTATKEVELSAARVLAEHVNSLLGQGRG